MEKQKILDELIKRANEEIDKAKKSFEKIKSLASEDDIKSESKWDTRKQEASYLASAHQKRKEELKLDISMLEEVEVSDYREGTEIKIGDLVTLKCNNQVKRYFLSPTFGGQIIGEGEDSILVISVFSPIGSELLGLKNGDSFEVETKNGEKEYLIEKVY